MYKCNEEDAIMAIIQQYHKDTNTTYVYESISYWDAEKGQSRSKRKCIGKIDPVTGEMVPTGRRGRKKKEEPSQLTNDELVKLNALYEQSQKEIAGLKVKASELEKNLSVLTKQNQKLSATLRMIQELASDN